MVKYFHINTLKYLLSSAIDQQGLICYFGSMKDEFIEKAKKYFKVGGILAVILSILISIFLYYLYRFTFICFDPELCGKADRPMIQIRP